LINKEGGEIRFTRSHRERTKQVGRRGKRAIRLGINAKKPSEKLKQTGGKRRCAVQKNTCLKKGKRVQGASDPITTALGKYGGENSTTG